MDSGPWSLRGHKVLTVGQLRLAASFLVSGGRVYLDVHMFVVVVFYRFFCNQFYFKFIPMKIRQHQYQIKGTQEI